MKTTAFTLAAFFALSGAAFAAPAKTESTPQGDVLATPSGATLYVYDGDKVDQGQQGRSSCSGQCAQEWPPFLAKSDDKASGKWSLIKRSDGSHQWAYDGRPLYTFAKAASPSGPTAGAAAEGNTWHAAKP